MPERIRTTVVGSYPVPAWLRAYPSRPALVDAIMVVLKTQELAGIDVVVDGELSRFDVNHPETNGMIDYFIRPMQGVITELTRECLESARQSNRLAYRTRPAGCVVGPVGEGTLNLAADYDCARRLTDKPLKFTVTSPYMLAQVLIDRHYQDRAELSMCIAEALARQVATINAPIVQIDEAHITGHAEDASWAATAINLVLHAVRGEKALHLCFGNYGGQTIQRGTWKALVDFLNDLDVDHVVLEFARRGYDELEVLRDIRPEIKLGIGVIDIKDNEVESPDLIADRIERTCKVVGPDRLAFVHPDCGFWMLQRSVADAKMGNLVKGRDAFEGRRG